MEHDTGRAAADADQVAIETELDPEQATIAALTGNPRIPLPDRIPFLPPTFLMVSGRYRLPTVEAPTPFPNRPVPTPIPTPIPIPIPDPDPGPIRAEGGAEEAALDFPQIPAIPFLRNEVIRLDVDGLYPQNTISGTIAVGLGKRVHWIASLTKTASGWTGPIWYRDGDVSLMPYSTVDVTAIKTPFTAQRRCTVTFSGPALGSVTRQYAYESAAFHEVELEYDRVEGTPLVLSINTGDHPNRPASVMPETITINTVFARAGFKVSSSGGDSTVPIAAAGSNSTWSDMEMHDAMQVHWSRFADKPQWSLWTLFAGRHDMGPSLGGIMFDSIGPNHRQGTALFLDSFISQPPPDDPAPDAWVRRMRFWTAVHEMGHAFNLAHSWQKALGNPWIPLANEPGALSFMNYPFRTPEPGGERVFFSKFQFRFSDTELLFMRHAPERFVQQGNADWFDNHAFEQALTDEQSALRLELRVNRERPVFQFLEPVTVELKLTNTSQQPVVVDGSVLTALDDLTLIIKRQNDPARQFRPYARRCVQPEQRLLQPGESLYEAVMISAGVNGFDVAEPGRYLVQAALHLPSADVVSNQLHLRVLPPRSFEEEHLAQDVYTDTVGRILALGGSQVLDRGNDVLHEVVERLPDTRLARHAQFALGNPQVEPFKVLRVESDGMQRFDVVKPEVKSARQDLNAALLIEPDEAAETFGHIPYKRAVDRYTSVLAAQDDPERAAEAQDTLLSTLANRGVLETVLDDVAACRDELRGEASES